MSLVFLCLPCCVDEQPPPRRRPRIDRSQIGLPTNFQHTGHIGSGEVASGFDVRQVQDSMQSKGGYDASTGRNETVTPSGIDLTAAGTTTITTAEEEGKDNNSSPSESGTSSSSSENGTMSPVNGTSEAQRDDASS